MMVCLGNQNKCQGAESTNGWEPGIEILNSPIFDPLKGDELSTTACQVSKVHKTYLDATKASIY